MAHPKALALTVLVLSFSSSVQARTVELSKSTVVYAEADKGSDELGLIARSSRVTVVETTWKNDCKQKWQKIEPRGWICTRTTTTNKAISTQSLPRLKNGELRVGRYGRVSKNSKVLVYKNKEAVEANEGTAPEKSMSVLRSGMHRIKGKNFWRTNGGLIESRFIRRYRPSKFQGVELRDRISLPVAWARPSQKDKDVVIYSAPDNNAKRVGSLAPKTQVAYFGESVDGDFIRIAKEQWILRSESRRALATKAPTEVGPSELWIDVDLQEQVLVAYQGSTPIYTTMISSGTRKHRTPPGKYRIQRKVAEKTMNSGKRDLDQYSVGGVPWVMYVFGTFALHGAYWHDRLGAPRSHGCVNLAPKDAQYIYGMVQPQVPAGWISANATEQHPGTLVHLRSSRKPDQSERLRYNTKRTLAAL